MLFAQRHSCLQRAREIPLDVIIRQYGHALGQLASWLLVIAVVWLFVTLWRARRGGWKRAITTSLPEAILGGGLAAIYALTVMPLATYLVGSAPNPLPPNLLPIVPMLTQYLGEQPDWILANLGMNIALYVPVGLGLAWRFGLRVRTVVLIGLLVTVAAETSQAFAPGRTSDVNDVLLNTLGAFVGALAGRRLARIPRPG